MKNWKTTLSGIASIIGGIAMFVNNPEQIQEAIGMVIIGAGLLFAKDSNVTGGTVKQNIIGGSTPPPDKDEK